jgi:hypothetical protein
MRWTRRRRGKWEHVDIRDERGWYRLLSRERPKPGTVIVAVEYRRGRPAFEITTQSLVDFVARHTVGAAVVPVQAILTVPCVGIERLEQLRAVLPEDVLLVELAEGEALESLDEERMRMAGWVRFGGGQ